VFHYLDNAATTPVRPEAAQAALEGHLNLLAAAGREVRP